MNRHTVTVVRPSGDVDYLGEGGVDTEFAVSDVIVAPRGSSEANDFSQTVLEDLTLFVPAGTDLRATDRVRWQGRLYAVAGRAALWESPFSGWTPGQQVALTRVEG